MQDIEALQRDYSCLGSFGTFGNRKLSNGSTGSLLNIKQAANYATFAETEKEQEEFKHANELHMVVSADAAAVTGTTARLQEGDTLSYL